MTSMKDAAGSHNQPPLRQVPEQELAFSYCHASMVKASALGRLEVHATSCWDVWSTVGFRQDVDLRNKHTQAILEAIFSSTGSTLSYNY